MSQRITVVSYVEEDVAYLFCTSERPFTHNESKTLRRRISGLSTKLGVALHSVTLAPNAPESYRRVVIWLEANAVRTNRVSLGVTARLLYMDDELAWSEANRAADLALPFRQYLASL